MLIPFVIYGSRMDTTTETVTAVAGAMDTADRSKKWTADKSGIAYATFNRKMHGGGDFTVQEVARIAAALGVHPIELMPAVFRTLAAAS